MLNFQLERRWCYHQMCPRGEPIDDAAGRIRSGWSAPPWDHVGWRLPASAGPRLKKGWQECGTSCGTPLEKFQRFPTCYQFLSSRIHRVWQTPQPPGLHMDSTGCLLGRNSAVLCLGRLWRLGAIGLTGHHGAHQEVQNSTPNCLILTLSVLLYRLYIYMIYDII